MSQSWYCPNCRKKLSDGEEIIKCSGCGANFGERSVWVPIESEKNLLPRNLSIVNVLAKLFGRLIIGAIFCVVIGIFLLLSSIPYGGGSQGIIILLRIVIISMAIWASRPIFILLLEWFSKKEENKLIKTCYLVRASWRMWFIAKFH